MKTLSLALSLEILLISSFQGHRSLSLSSLNVNFDCVLYKTSFSFIYQKRHINWITYTWRKRLFMTIAATTRVQKKLQFGMCSLPLLCRFEHAFSIIEKAWIQELIRVHDLSILAVGIDLVNKVGSVERVDIIGSHVGQEGLPLGLSGRLANIESVIIPVSTCFWI